MWTKTRPIPPKIRPSKFFWYYSETDKELFPVELYPGRYIKHYDGWWWDVAIDMPNIPDTKNSKQKL